MLLVEMSSGPVYVDRTELERALSGVEREFVVLFMSGQNHEAVGRELLASGVDLVCESLPFTEAVKQVSGRTLAIDRRGLAVPRLPMAARLSVLIRSLLEQTADPINPAEAVAMCGGSVILLD